LKSIMQVVCQFGSSSSLNYCKTIAYMSSGSSQLRKIKLKVEVSRRDNPHDKFSSQETMVLELYQNLVKNIKDFPSDYKIIHDDYKI